LKNGIAAGILVYNLKKMREDNVVQLIMKTFEDYKDIITQPEQDILNISLNGRIDFLPIRYCFCTYMYNLFRNKYKMNLKVKGGLINYWFKLYKKNLKYDKHYNEEDLMAAFAKPAIIHYAARTKPWNTVWTKRKFDWLCYLMKTPFWKQYFFRT